MIMSKVEWKMQGNYLIREFRFPDFVSAINFINQVAELAENQNHHPDILLHNYNQIEIRLTSHQKKRVTEKDIQLASAIDKINTSS